MNGFTASQLTPSRLSSEIAIIYGAVQQNSSVFLLQVQRSLQALDYPCKLKPDLQGLIPESVVGSIHHTVADYLSHINRAWRLHQQYCSKVKSAQSMMHAADHLTTGIIGLDATFVARYTNQYAQNFLHAVNNSDWRQLLSRLQLAQINREIKSWQSMPFEQQVIVTRLESKVLPYLACIKSASKQNAPQPIRYWVYFKSTLSATEIDTEYLKLNLKLSPSEIDVSLGLCEGKTLREYAEQKGITYATARSQLKTVFKKSGVKSQEGLVYQFLFSNNMARIAA